MLHATAFLLIVTGCMNIKEDMHRGENPRGTNSRTRTCVQMECSKDAKRPESSNFVRKPTAFFTDGWRIKRALESCFEEHAKKVWETIG